MTKWNESRFLLIDLTSQNNLKIFEKYLTNISKYGNIMSREEELWIIKKIILKE